MHTTSPSYIHDTITVSRAYLSYMCALVMFASLTVYGYLLVSSVMHVVALRAMDAEQHSLERQVHALETRQVRALHAVTYEYAHAQGLVAAANKVFLDEVSAFAVRR